MKRQKSFENNKATLYLVATPIGNLSEFSSRAIEILKLVDVIACEDTRTSRILLEKYGIKKKLVAYHNFNEVDSAKGLLALLENGDDVALVSDAGYPLISDPGYHLVNEVIAHDFNVVTISGPSAHLNALVASGLDTMHYLYYGFLSDKRSKAQKELSDLSDLPYTLIFYEAPHRIKKTLALAFEILGKRRACIARELTKKHEEYIRGDLEELMALDDLKGEIVLLIEGKKEKARAFDEYMIFQMVSTYIEEGLSSKDAIKKVAEDTKINKNQVYEDYLKLVQN